MLKLPVSFKFFVCTLLICAYVACVLGTEVVGSTDKDTGLPAKQEERIRESVSKILDNKLLKSINVTECSEHKGLYEVSVEVDAVIGSSPLATRKSIFRSMRLSYMAIYRLGHPACNVTLSAHAPAEKMGYLTGKVKPGELLWKTSLTEERARTVRWGRWPGGFLSGLRSTYTNLPLRWQEHFIHPLLAAGRGKGRAGY